MTERRQVHVPAPHFTRRGGACRRLCPTRPRRHAEKDADRLRQRTGTLGPVHTLARGAPDQDGSRVQAPRRGARLRRPRPIRAGARHDGGQERSGGGQRGERGFHHQRAARGRGRRRHRQAARRAPGDPAPRPPVHGEGGRQAARARLGRRCLRPRRGPARRLVRRDARFRQHRCRDRLQLPARRHRDRVVRPLRRRATALQVHAPPALQRLLPVAQLRQPPDRLQAGVLHPAAPESLPRRSGKRFPGAAPLAPGRDTGRVPPHRPGHAHLPRRGRPRPIPRTRAAYGHHLRPGEAGPGLREHRRDGATGSRVLCLDGLGIRLDRRLGGVPHPAGRRRAQRPQGGRHAHRPVFVPRGRRRTSQRAAAARRTSRRGYVGRGGRAGRTGALPHAAGQLLGRPRRRAALQLSPLAAGTGPRAAESLRRRIPSVRRGRRLAQAGAGRRRRPTHRCAR